MKRSFIYQPVILFVTILFTLSGCSGEKARRAELLNNFQLKLDSLKAETGFPGATVKIIINDAQFQLASGFADIEKGILMEPNDRMFTGSVGKTFVAAVALQLVDERRIDMDNLISEYFGKEEWLNRIPNGRDITIRMLMNHTGGLPRYVLKDKFWNDFNNDVDKVWSPVELLSYIFDDNPVHPAGKGWSYSDTNYIILGMIIENVCGDTYYNELSRRILIPYGLEYTTPSISRDIPGLVPGYTGDGKPPFKLPGKVIVEGRYVVNPQFEWTGGGLVANTHDLAEWAKILYTGNVLPKYLLDEMMTPVNETTGLPAETGYGLGVQVWSSDDGLVYGHGGIFPGYLTQIYFIPELNTFMAMQINTDTLSGKLDRPIGRILAAFIPMIREYLKGSSKRS